MELTRLATCVVAVVMLAVLSSCGGMGTAPYKNAKLPVEQRVDDLLGRMTLEEKVDMLSGGTWMDTRAIPRLGIPALKTTGLWE